MWLVGNEWNLNRLYDTCAGDACAQRIEEVARRIKMLDPRHPVATSFAPMGELPTEADLRRLPSVDVWGLNIYSQPGFFNRFTNWRLLAQQTGLRKPFFLSEYGADAYDNLNRRPDEAGPGRGPAPPDLGDPQPAQRPQPGLPLPGRHPLRMERRVVEAGQPRRAGPRRLRQRGRGRRPLRQRGVVGRRRHRAQAAPGLPGVEGAVRPMMKQEPNVPLPLLVLAILPPPASRPAEPPAEPLPVPFVVSDYYSPDGFFGDGETRGLVELTKQPVPSGCRARTATATRSPTGRA